MIQLLRESNINSLHDVCIGIPQPRGRIGGKTRRLWVYQLISRRNGTLLSRCCAKISSLSNEGSEDTLCWSKNLKEGTFTTKLGYKAWAEERQETSAQVVVESLMENQIPS
jgi:hypothetical protein